LPPYSPDLNPIEEAFAELKAWCKKHRTEAERMGFEEFLEYAMENMKDGGRGHFARSRVGMPIRDGSEEDYWDD
jgi:DDE superfamily endonuclease